MNRPSTIGPAEPADDRAGPAAADETGAPACDTERSSRPAMPHRSPSPPAATRPAAAPRSVVAVAARRPAAHAPASDLDELRDQAEPSGHGDAPDPHEPLGPDDPLAPLPFNPYKGNRGVTRAWHALKNSLAGFRTAIREESAFRQELTLAAILLPIGIVVPVAPVERVLLLGSVLLVLIVELLNSSVEAAIDRISLERHELSRRAKDFGSAAVMIALVACVMTWLLILVPAFGPPLVHWLRAR